MHTLPSCILGGPDSLQVTRAGDLLIVAGRDVVWHDLRTGRTTGFGPCPNDRHP
jgi:hypothetical protein